ncbi:hypothetical protein CXF68_12540 [Tenacibaculum sp. Bg11-29]|uniref:hypothetical protein n=1 Tax=Tenacibaculum sp. Bg11-29 TaxID=2058306 RepID=UPI000C339660|nr:hypothetical protein [Tenacibaculum sp. Bg11-29]PKH51460.1 hypothetical protein CXF68_12540 [Tenacibaculum sp. Bg11-29]
MGEDKNINELDAFSKKYIKEIKIETPSIDFTANLMDTLLQKENSEIYKATALISKKVWFVLVGVLGVCILYVSRGTSLTWMKMPKVNLDFFSRIQIPNLFEGITVSNTMLFACFFFTLMFFGQIYLLKNHFTKNLNV